MFWQNQSAAEHGPGRDTSCNPIVAVSRNGPRDTQSSLGYSHVSHGDRFGNPVPCAHLDIYATRPQGLHDSQRTPYPAFPLPAHFSVHVGSGDSSDNPSWSVRAAGHGMLRKPA